MRSTRILRRRDGFSSLSKGFREVDWLIDKLVILFCIVDVFQRSVVEDRNPQLEWKTNSREL
jgi:hypothetical protein